MIKLEESNFEGKYQKKEKKAKGSNPANGKAKEKYMCLKENSSNTFHQPGRHLVSP